MKTIKASRKHMSRSYCMREKAQKRAYNFVRVLVYASIIGLIIAIIKTL